MKYNMSEIMKRAWSFFRTTKESFSECLKKSWKVAKGLTVRYIIPDWFMNKNIDKVTTAHLECFQTFSANDIVRETEKAICVCLGMMVKSTGAESKYTKNVWVPKSVVETYSF